MPQERKAGVIRDAPRPSGGVRLVGTRGAEVSKRFDTYATALHHDMTVAGMSDPDLSYTPPLGSPWDAVQMATQAWERDARSLTAAI